MIDDDAKAIIRTVRDLLVETRPYLDVAEEHFRALLLEPPALDVAEARERVDGAIAEADEVLS